MHTFEQTADILTELIDTLPEDLFKNLNGGVLLQPYAKHNLKIPSSNYWILGEYQVDPIFGRKIMIYYGSFMALYIDLSITDLTKELFRVLKHELRHHLEHQAGIRDLELEDEKYVLEALNKLRLQNRT